MHVLALTHCQASSQQLRADYFEFQVRREFVLEDPLKEVRRDAFHPYKQIKVANTAK